MALPPGELSPKVTERAQKLTYGFDPWVSFYYFFILKVSAAVLRVAVGAAVNAFLRVREVEDVVDLLLGGRDAAGIFAPYHVGKRERQLDILLLKQLAVADDVHGDIRTDVGENAEVKLDIIVYLDDVLCAHALARHAHQKRDGAGQLVKLKHIVDLHCLAGNDVVDNDTVFNGVYTQFIPPPEV